MYIKLTNEIPEIYTLGMLRKDNPNVSFPKTIPEETLAEYGVFPCTVLPDPDYDTFTQKLIEQEPKNINNVWTKQKAVVDLTPEEQAEIFNQKIEQFELIVSQYLNDTVKVKGYDNIVSACSYAGHTNRFQAEGQAAIEFRANVWDTCYTILADVQAGTRTIPTPEELILELPTIVWP